MEGRMTVCNMADRRRRARRPGGAWTTRPSNTSRAAPGAHGREWDAGRRLLEDAAVRPDANFDAVVELDARRRSAAGDLGTQPEMVWASTPVPDPDREKDPNKRGAIGAP